MKVISIPGCWYLDSLPSGEYAGIIPTQHQIQTHTGLMPYPADEPLWLVIDNRPMFRMAGQGHATGVTWEWRDDGLDWSAQPGACGVWALIYAADGLHIAKCAPPTGSQGWRYVAPDGSLVTGDATVLARHGLNERTDLSTAQDGSIEIGQGHDGQGAEVWADGALRMLHAGACFNIRAKWDQVSDSVSASFYVVAPDNSTTGWVYWMTMAELKALPVVVPVADLSPRIDRTIWFGGFAGDLTIGGGWTTDTDPHTLPGNCYITIPGGEIRTMDGHRLGWYVQGYSETDSDSIDAAIVAAKVAHPGEMILAEWPKAAWGRVPVGANEGVVAYQEIGESDAAFEASVRLAAARCLHPWMIPQCFTSNSAFTTNLRGVAVICARIAHDIGCNVLVFNFSGRATGLQDHPEMLPVYTELAATVTTPALPAPSPVPVPVPKPSPIPPVKEPSMPALPVSPTVWQNDEYPQVLAARLARVAREKLDWQESTQWAIFQTMVRYGLAGVSDTNRVLVPVALATMIKNEDPNAPEAP